ncbi:2009_t:CDS:1, partial [Entrophospora sp. SA101]
STYRMTCDLHLPRQTYFIRHLISHVNLAILTVFHCKKIAE